MYITREKFLSRTLIYGTREGYVLDMCPVRVGPKPNLYIKRLVCLGGGNPFPWHVYSQKHVTEMKLSTSSSKYDFLRQNF